MGSHNVTDANRLSLHLSLLTQEWNYDKNILTPDDVAVNCTKMAWWKCSKCNFEWQSLIINRYAKLIRKNDRSRLKNIENSASCPYCQSFLSRRPELQKEWDYTKNKIEPIKVGISNEKYWWKCSVCSYEWQASVINRSMGNGNCPNCNSLQSNYPELSKEFNVVKNKIDPRTVSYGSSKKVWWKCNKCNHEWMATVSSRTNGNGCPKCKKIFLKDGSICSSKAEAYWYLKFKKEGKIFIHDKVYGKDLGYSRYDFYFPSDNAYVEVTSFHKKSKVSYIDYLRNIVRKRRYVRDVLRANFVFLNYRLTKRSEEKALLL